jgi:hypothetical protein
MRSIARRTQENVAPYQATKKFFKKDKKVRKFRKSRSRQLKENLRESRENLILKTYKR